MNKRGFRKFLEARKFPPEQMGAFISFAEKFAAYYEKYGDKSQVEIFTPFSNLMMAENLNTFENYYAIALYGRFLKNNALSLAALELIDGGEAR